MLEGCRKLVVRGEAKAVPNPAEALRYDAVFSLYGSLYEALRPSFHKLADLRRRLDGEKLPPKSVFSVEFERFGRVVEGVNTAKITELLKQVNTPTDAVTYVPSEPILETEDLMADLQNRVFGGLKIQIGYCNGHNRVLNCLENHRNNELNVTGTDALFKLAPMTAIKDGIIDTSAVETFFAPAGTAVLFYETTLHYAPCHVDGQEVFRVAVVLPKDTNTERPAGVQRCGEAGCLTHNNKWLYAHKDSPEGKAGLTTGVLVGENIKL